MKKTKIKIEISLNDEEIKLFKSELDEIKQIIEKLKSNDEFDENRKSVLWDIIIEISKKIDDDENNIKDTK